MSTSDSSSKPEVGMKEVIETAKSIWTSQTSEALVSAEQSQSSLGSQLECLEKDMSLAISVLSSTDGVGQEICKSIYQTRQSLLRSRQKLTTVRARVGRLRSLEQAHRLSITKTR